MAYDMKNFDQSLSENPVTVVMFGAPWCGPCKNLKPKFEAMLSGGKLGFGYCNLEESPELASRYNIMNLPTFVVFKGADVQKVAATSLEGEVKKLVGFAGGLT